MKDWIYGKNAVYEAVKKKDGLSQVVLSKEGKDDKLVAICKKNRIPVVFEDRSFFNKNAKGNHQGYMALKESYEYVELEDMLSRIPKGKQPLLIMLDGLEDPHNLGAILRSADATGADGIIIGKNRSVSLNATVALLSDEKLIGEYTISNKKTHSQVIMPMICDLLEKCSLKIDHM